MRISISAKGDPARGVEGVAPKGLFAGDLPDLPEGSGGICASMAGTCAGVGERRERGGAGFWAKRGGVSGIWKSQCPKLFTTQSLF